MTSHILNLGSGNRKINGAINVDLSPHTNPEVVHDLDQLPWPFADSQFSEVHAYDVLEHLADVVGAVAEIHRVSSPGARIHITVPHFSCDNAFTDPTHRHYFGHRSFDYFSEASPLSYYSVARFRYVRRQFVFYPTLVNKMVWRLANRFPARYERGWAWIFPAWFLSFELEALKAS